MLYLTILILCLLAILNYRIGRRALYPPFVLCGTWIFNLVLIRLAGDFFYPLSDETLLIFLCGAFAFSVGSSLALLCPQMEAKIYRTSAASHRILNYLLFVTVAAFPFYVRWIIGLVRERGIGSFLGSARAATLEASGRGLMESFFFNLATLSILVAALAFREKDGHRKRAVLAVTVALAMNILLGAKAGGITLLLALMCMSWMRRRRFPWKFIVVMSLMIVLLFGFLQFSVQMGGSVVDNIGPLSQALVLYIGGPTVAYDRVVRQPAIVTHTYPIYYVFLHLLRNFGVRLTLPDETGYVQVGPGASAQNAYTMYWSYLDLGPIWMIVILAAVGFVITLVYRRAIQSGPVAQVMYGFLFAGLVLSIFAEYFFVGLNFLSKQCVGAWLVYSFPAMYSQFRNLVGGRVKTELLGYQSLPDWK